jgi:hypothetical protein
MTQRRHPTPVLDRLTPAELAVVLSQLLAAQHELVEHAEHLARQQVAQVDADAVAEDVAAALRWIDVDQLAGRAGRVRGRGYVHESEAAYELLEEAVQPYLDDLQRRVALGMPEAVLGLGVGIIRGLAQCRTGVEDGSVLAYAGEDVVDELAESVSTALRDAGVDVPDEELDNLPEGWGRAL